MRPVAVGTLPDDLLAAIHRGGVSLTAQSASGLTFRDIPNHTEWSFTLSTPRPIPYRPSPTNHAVLTDSMPHFSPIALPDPTLTLAVARFLAPAPCAWRGLRQQFASHPPEALTAVLREVASTNRRGECELSARGYAMVELEWYASKGERQRVANLALPKVAQDAALVERFALYADRDVMLAACSRGIMAGLGGAKRERQDVESPSDSETERAPNETDTNAAADTPAARFTSMEQSGIRWGDGDVAAASWTMSAAVKEALEGQRQFHTERQTCRYGENGVLRPMPVTTSTQLEAAGGIYHVLRREHTALVELLRRHEEITEAATQWVQKSGNRFSPELRVEVGKWFETQTAPRESLRVALAVLHKALYELKREVEDYVNLREWGVLTE